MSDPSYQVLAQTAAGTGIADALAIPSRCSLFQVSTCTNAAYAVKLPATADAIVGSHITIRNDSDPTGTGSILHVFPGAAGDIIKPTAAGLAHYVGCGASYNFRCLSNSGGVVTWAPGGYNGPRPVFNLPDAALTLNAAHHDTICRIPALTASRVYTLPPVATPGFRVRFVNGATVAGGFLWKISAQSAVLNGQLQTGLLAAVTTEAKHNRQCANSTSIEGVNGGLAGDFVDLYSDGVKWVLFGRSTYIVGDTAMFTVT